MYVWVCIYECMYVYICVHMCVRVCYVCMCVYLCVRPPYFACLKIRTGTRELPYPIKTLQRKPDDLSLNPWNNQYKNWMWWYLSLITALLQKHGMQTQENPWETHRSASLENVAIPKPVL